MAHNVLEELPFDSKNQQIVIRPSTADEDQ